MVFFFFVKVSFTHRFPISETTRNSFPWAPPPPNSLLPSPHVPFLFWLHFIQKTHLYYYFIIDYWLSIKRKKKMEDSHSAPKSLMENLLGLLRVRVKRGVNLAVRDVRSSDPYVVIKMYNQVPSSSPPIHRFCLYPIVSSS